jgi:membrane-associated phospholipid phosphatase
VPTAAQSLDGRIAGAIYSLDSAGSRAVLGAVDRSAYPVFLSSIPATWVYCEALGGCPREEAIRVTVALGSAYLLTSGLKRLVRAPRPMVRASDRPAKVRYPGARGLEGSFSFPSGHAALAAALAVTWSAGARGPAVPAALSAWAVGVGVSRVWLGVHYPSDVLAGWALGAGIGYLAGVMIPNSRSEQGVLLPALRLSW